MNSSATSKDSSDLGTPDHSSISELSPSITSPAALKTFRTALASGTLANRTADIRTLTVVFSADSPDPAPLTVEWFLDLLWVLARLTHLAHLVLHVPLAQHRVPLRAPLRSLNADAPLLPRLRAPVPPLRALSITVLVAGDARATYTAVSRLFAQSLVRLRVIRVHDCAEGDAAGGVSPARVCAALALHRLEYLEVRDLSEKVRTVLPIASA